MTLENWVKIEGAMSKYIAVKLQNVKNFRGLFGALELNFF